MSVADDHFDREASLVPCIALVVHNRIGIGYGDDLKFLAVVATVAMAAEHDHGPR